MPEAPQGRKFTGRVEWPVKAEIGKGLEGAVTGETAIGYVDGQKGDLVYRGYSIYDLAEHSSYEETTYLLIYGSLPTKSELDGFKAKLKSHRVIPTKVTDILRMLPKETHPMAALRTGVSALGCYDPKADDTSLENETELGVKVTSQIATIAATIARLRKGKEPVAPDNSLDHTANLLWMMTGEKPDDFFTKVMDVSMILHADHGMNNSTFTSITVNSTMSDMYSSIVAGIASLKGPLHGGANERALADMMGIKDEKGAEQYVKDAVASKKKIMGFGHRVYKAYDPRAKVLGAYSKEVTEKKGMATLYKVAHRVEEEVIKAYGERGIFPNVDFYSGTIYYALGIDIPMFTPLFAVSRTAGWAARVLEYLADNRIMRPRAVYIGEFDRKYTPLEAR